MERVSILDLARRVLDATASASDLEFVSYDEVYGRGIEDMLHRIPAIEKVRAAIGWQPTRSLDDILGDVIEASDRTTAVIGTTGAAQAT
jgi:UDP-glucose 4-epimerase